LLWFYFFFIIIIAGMHMSVCVCVCVHIYLIFSGLKNYTNCMGHLVSFNCSACSVCLIKLPNKNRIRNRNWNRKEQTSAQNTGRQAASYVFGNTHEFMLPLDFYE